MARTCLINMKKVVVSTSFTNLQPCSFSRLNLERLLIQRLFLVKPKKRKVAHKDAEKQPLHSDWSIVDVGCPAGSLRTRRRSNANIQTSTLLMYYYSYLVLSKLKGEVVIITMN